MSEWERVVKALRDTADKAMETQEFEVPDVMHDMNYPQFNREKTTMRIETRERFSKEWVSGRIQGIADAIEAMMPQPDAPSKANTETTK